MGHRRVTVFAEHHEMFRATVRAFVEREVAPHVEAWEAAGRIPKSIWPRMGELGLLGVEYDEKYGGAGADLLTTAVLHEECARSRSGSFAMAVGVHTDMASPHLYWTGSEALKEAYLPAICRGEKLCAIAVTEPGGGSDVAAIRTRATRDGDHYVLNGAKMFITNGALADLYFVAARVEAGDTGRRHRGISMFLLERETPGFTVSRTLAKTGMLASDTAELSFQDARVPADHLLGREGVGFYEVMRVFQRERLVAGLHAVSMSQRALEDTSPTCASARRSAGSGQAGGRVCGFVVVGCGVMYLYLVAARVEAGDTGRRHRGISMFLLERETPGFTVSRTLAKTGMLA